jgi:hypothetical protein
MNTFNFNKLNSINISDDTDYKRPKKTITDILQNYDDVKEKLENYEEVNEEDINFLTIGSHLRYITYDIKNNIELFRCGGNLKKIGDEYVVLVGKRRLSFSVKRYSRDKNNNIIHVTRFFRKNNSESNSGSNIESNIASNSKSNAVLKEEYLNKKLSESALLLEQQQELIEKQKHDINKLNKKLKKYENKS